MIPFARRARAAKKVVKSRSLRKQRIAVRASATCCVRETWPPQLLRTRRVLPGRNDGKNVAVAHYYHRASFESSVLCASTPCIYASSFFSCLSMSNTCDHSSICNNLSRMPLRRARQATNNTTDNRYQLRRLLKTYRVRNTFVVISTLFCVVFGWVGFERSPKTFDILPTY